MHKLHEFLFRLLLLHLTLYTSGFNGKSTKLHWDVILKYRDQKHIKYTFGIKGSQIPYTWKFLPFYSHCDRCTLLVMWRQWNHRMQKNTRHCWNYTYFLRLTLLYRIYFICGCLIKWECFQNIFVHFFHTIVLLSRPNWDHTVCVWPMNDYKFDWRASTFPPFDTCNKKNSQETLDSH